VFFLVLVLVQDQDGSRLAKLGNLHTNPASDSLYNVTKHRILDVVSGQTRGGGGGGVDAHGRHMVGKPSFLETETK